MAVEDTLKKFRITVDKNGKIEKLEDPEFLKQVLALTTDEIIGMSEDMRIRIASLKAPKGYRLVQKGSRIVDRVWKPGTLKQDLRIDPRTIKLRYELEKL